jgi:small subunit ribosomal protein S1
MEAIVLGVDVDNERISLGVKQLEGDPWEDLLGRMPVGTRVKGPVTSITDFGVFVKLEDGIEGLVHVSQISADRIDRPADHFQIGDEVEAEVTNIDARDKKIGLSIRALRRSEERAEMDAYMSREGSGSRFSLEDVVGGDLQRAAAGDKDKPED